MAIRKKTKPDVEEEVLSACRRRCALCFGLRRDAHQKRGQIAHLDHDPSNGAIDNLAFLCHEHHDEYDSTSRQAKGITIGEVKRYRAELVAAVKSEWSKPVSFGRLRQPPIGIAGRYIWNKTNSSAELEISQIGEGLFKVSGFALWGNARGAPNSGSVDFRAEERLGRLYYQERTDTGLYTLELVPGPDGLEALESGPTNMYGMNVRFQGEYVRAPDMNVSGLDAPAL